jgi:hypothetical protein
LRGGLVTGAPHESRVAGDVADDRIQLGERDREGHGLLARIPVSSDASAAVVR